MDLSQYVAIFLEESEEHLQALNTYLLQLEKEPSKEVVDEIFRSAHTLKGMAATMGFDSIAKLTHQMENVLQKLRTNEMDVTTDLVDVLFKCLDSLEIMIKAVNNSDGETVDVSDLMEVLVRLEKNEAASTSVSSQIPSTSPDAADIPAVADAQTGSTSEAAKLILALNQYEERIIIEAKKKMVTAYEIVVNLQEGCILKQARAFMVFSALQKMGDIIKSYPLVQEIEKEEFELEIAVIFLTDQLPEKVKKSILSIAEIESVSIESIKTESFNTDEALEDDTQKATGEDGKKIPGKQMKSDQSAAAVAKTSQTVRVDIERLDKLMNLVGELVISKTRLDQIGKNNNIRELSETTEHIDRISNDLQTIVMQVRMVPVEQVFNRFPRMVRDLSKELGKQINFIIEGQETELDRTVIDEIGDPIVHLLRNSIDHGIESPEERKGKGKSEIGNIYLRARHEGNNVVIEVEDDGNGLDVEILKESAIRKGILSAADSERLSENELLSLIFMAGFSTAKVVTDVSGRGVGMDAVKTKIESLSGTIKIETELNKYTRISIWLPLTLAIIQALMVKLNDEIYAIPLANIEETIAIDEQAIKYVQNKEVTVLRGNTLPLLRLHYLLETAPDENRTDAFFNIVVVRKGEKRAGFIVDDLIGQQEIVIKSLGKLLTGVHGIAGATILGGGEIALILDVDAII